MSDGGHTAAAAADSDQFEAALTWRAAEPLIPGRRYELVPHGVPGVGARVATPKYRVGEDGHHLAARTLMAGEYGVAVITTERPLPLADTPDAAFQLVDGAGVILADGVLSFALQRSTNLHWQEVTIDKTARREMNGHGAATVWFTGLSGAGKSAIANETERRLHALGVRTYLLDGDNVRHGMNKDLGFTEADRIENIRRVGEVAKLMVDAGLVVLTALISPFREDRWWARDLFEPGEFCEVWVDTPLEVAEQRDIKGLYAKARRGKLTNFTGIDSPYEPPLQPEVHLRTTELSPAESADRVIARLRALGVVLTA